MNSSPLISVVIPVLNGARTISAQLDALAQQSYEGHWELLVSDNGSTDETRKLVTAHRIAQLIPTTIVDASVRRGINTARNIGVAASEGRFILLCDSDDVVHTRWIEAYAGALAHSPDAVAAGPLIPLLVDGRSRGSEALYLDRPKPIGDFCTGYGANMGFTRHIWESLHGFDDRFTSGGYDEVDFFYRAQTLGATFLWIPDAVVQYRVPTAVRHLARRGIRFGRFAVQFDTKHPAAHHLPGARTTLRYLIADLRRLVIDTVRRRPLAPAVHSLSFNLGVLLARRSTQE